MDEEKCIVAFRGRDMRMEKEPYLGNTLLINTLENFASFLMKD